MRVLNGSGGGVGAHGGVLATIQHYERSGQLFDKYLGVSGSGPAMILASCLGVDEAIDFTKRELDKAWDFNRDWYWSWLPWKGPVKSFVKLDRMRDAIKKRLLGEDFMVEVVIQCLDLYSGKSVYLSSRFFRLDHMVDFSIYGMSIPGLAIMGEVGDSLLCDSGLKNNIALSEMNEDDEIVVCSIHGDFRAVTQSTYEEMSALDLLGVTTASMATDVYNNDKKELLEKYPNVTFVEAQKKLEVFKYSEEAFNEAFDHFGEVLRG